MHTPATLLVYEDMGKLYRRLSVRAAAAGTGVALIAVIGIASVAYGTATFADTTATSTDDTVVATSTDSGVSTTTPLDVTATSTEMTASTTPTEDVAATSTDATSTIQEDAITTSSSSSTSESTPTTTSAPTPEVIESETSTTTPSGPPLVAVTLECTSAYTGPLYDTPSGHLDSGFYLNAIPTNTSSTSTTPITGTVAHVIGTQSWIICHDTQGNAHEIAITGHDYANLVLPNAVMPRETVMEPATQAALDSF